MNPAPSPINTSVSNPIKAVSPSPIQNPTPKVNNPVQNPPIQPPINKQPDFTNFFGKTDQKPIETKPEVSPDPKRNILATEPKQQPTLNQKDFANFFGTTSGQQPPIAPQVDPIKNPPKPTPPVQPTADKPPE